MQRSSKFARGFTLLELIIVLVVLAALAALVIPLLGWVRDQAKFATSAAGAAEVLNNLELYKASMGKYPDRFDSLVAGGTTGSSNPTTLYTAANFGLGRVSTAAEAGNLAYYMQHGGGIGSLVNHATNATDPNFSTQSSPIFSTGGTEGRVDGDGNPVLNPDNGQQYQDSTARFAIVDPATSTLFATWPRIVRAAFPNQSAAGSPTIPAGHTLIAVGVGERCSAVGTTMSSAPVWGGAAQGTYGRYIAFFDVTAGPSGRGKVQLKLVTDSEFSTIARATQLYKGSGPTDDAGQ